MQYVFVDETGDPGRKKGFTWKSTPYFGMATFSIGDKEYSSLRLLLSQIHWLRGTASTIELRRTYNKAMDIMRGLKELSNKGLISATGIYINKADSGGRYLTWSDMKVHQSEWPYYLRNYLLRHLLELHFSKKDPISDVVDLVLDRVTLNEEQRVNTHDYLNSRTEIPLREPFSIPKIEYITICDSEYVGGLEIAHVLADVLRETITETITPEVKALSDFIKIRKFVGHKKDA